jgi:hypothetical protein
MLRNTIINIVLKIGLSISLLYASLASFIVPATVIEYWPNFISNNVSENFLSIFTGIVSLVYIVWIFSGRYRFASVSSLSIIFILFGISNIYNVGLLFNIAPIFCISLALSLRYYPRVRIVAQTKVTPLEDQSRLPIENINPGAELLPEKTMLDLDTSSKSISIEEKDINNVDESAIQKKDKDHDQHLFVSGH